MRHESTGRLPSANRRTPRFLVPAVALLLGAPLVAQAADVVVRVDGVMPSAAAVYVSLCRDGLEPDDCALAQTVAASGPAVAVRFSDVSPGIYAAAAFQDLNGNGTLDRSPRGLPREPYGFSREAGRSTTPRFERAAFSVGPAGASVDVHLAMPGRP